MTETKKYCLACTCGRKSLVAAAQAGSEIQCSCGKTLTVPRLMALRKLPSSQGQQKKEASKSDQSDAEVDYSRRIMFFVGSIVLVLGLLLMREGLANPPSIESATQTQNMFLHKGEWVNQNFEPLTPQEFNLLYLTAEDIEDMPPQFSWQLWTELEKGPLPSSSLEGRLNKVRNRYYAWVGIGSALILIGLITLGSATAGKILQDKQAKNRESA